MFFGDDHKKIATIMVGKRNSKGDRTAEPTAMKPEITKTEDGQMDGRHAAAQDMMAAMHEKSPEKFSQALKNYMDIHNSTEDEGESSGETVE